MRTYQVCWSDKRRPRGRYPALYFVRDGQIVAFSGEKLPGICRLLRAVYKKAGIWSGTDYEMEVAGDWTAVEVIDPWEGIRAIQTWADFVKQATAILGGPEISEEALREVIKRHAKGRSAWEQAIQRAEENETL